jgi:peptidylprolyl isomerase
MRAPIRTLAVLFPCLLFAACGAEDEAPAPPPPPKSPPTAGWDLSRLPDLGKPLREWTTPQDVRVLVLREGSAEEAVPLAGMDLLVEGYLLGGQPFMRSYVLLDRPGGMRAEALITGLAAGVEKLQPGERRRILVPAAEAFRGDPPDPTVPRGADMVFDVTRARWAVKDLILGGGELVKEGQTILAHYRGTLEDGTVFDDSRKHNKGEPAKLPVQRAEKNRGGVIEGWVRGIPGMRVGGQRRLEIPAMWAYAARGSPNGAVPPHAHLSFVVEVVGIVPPDAR